MIKEGKFALSLSLDNNTNNLFPSHFSGTKFTKRFALCPPTRIPERNRFLEKHCNNECRQGKE